MAPDPEVVINDNTPEAEKRRLEVITEEARLSTTASTSDQWQQIGNVISEFLSALPNYITEFFGEYQRPLITIGLILAGLISIKLSLALIDAINDIPVVKQIFEIVGIGYTTWFVYRYLLSAASRQEIFEEIQTFKEQVIGK